MTRTGDDAHTRLRAAALALFLERGYDKTTAAEIAARAGVTERTFFRYFPDKREVLFDGEAAVRGALTSAIADAPPEFGPLETLFFAFRSFQPALTSSWSYSKPRHEVISATPALQERELTKFAALADALAMALKARGVSEPHAFLAAQAGMVAFVHAIMSWLDDPKVGLCERFDFVHSELKSLWAEC